MIAIAVFYWKGLTVQSSSCRTAWTDPSHADFGPPADRPDGAKGNETGADARRSKQGLPNQRDRDATARRPFVIARALVPKPKNILADEPTGILDTAKGDTVMDLLKGASRAGPSTIMGTHAPVHAERAQRLVKMLDGRIVSETQA